MIRVGGSGRVTMSSLGPWAVGTLLVKIILIGELNDRFHWRVGFKKRRREGGESCAMIIMPPQTTVTVGPFAVIKPQTRFLPLDTDPLNDRVRIGKKKYVCIFNRYECRQSLARMPRNPWQKFILAENAEKVAVGQGETWSLTDSGVKGWKNKKLNPWHEVGGEVSKYRRVGSTMASVFFFWLLLLCVTDKLQNGM